MAEIVKKVNGKEYGFKFTMLTIDKYCELRGIEFHELDRDIVEHVSASNNAMLRAAIDVYSKGKECIDEYQCDELIDAMSQDDYNEIMIEWNEGMLSILRRLNGGKLPNIDEVEKKN